MRYELTDFEWAAIKPFLPNKPRGVPRVNDRRVLNGIFWVLRSGAPTPSTDLVKCLKADGREPDGLGSLARLYWRLAIVDDSAAPRRWHDMFGAPIRHFRLTTRDVRLTLCRLRDFDDATQPHRKCP